MTGSREFLQRFEEFMGASGWRSVLTPPQLVASWREFVEVCEEGYSSTIYEYENDRMVRDLIESALRDPGLGKFPEIDALRGAVAEIDERFRRICRGDVSMAAAEAPWWRRCVPLRAEGELASDLHRLFGIDVA